MKVRFDEFDKISKSQWIEQVRHDLKGKMDPDQMTYQLDQNIHISPFVTDQDVTTTTRLEMPTTIAGAIVKIFDNDHILRALNDGASAIWLTLEDDHVHDYQADFTGVYTAMVDWIIDDRHCSSTTRVAFKEFFNPISDTQKVVYLLSSLALNQEMTPSDRILAVKTSKELNAILLPLRQDFLGQIAELRAIRLVTNDPNTPIKIIGTMPQGIFDSSDRQSLIAINYLIMSGYLGGCDYVFGLPYGDNNDIMARLTLNIQHILQMESHLSHVKDPMAGSYLIETMTTRLTEM